jgi:hypothetical protein
LRSFLFTTVLAALAVLLGALAIWQAQDGNLKRLLGTPPVTIGNRIYPNFPRDQVATIKLASNGIEAVFSKTEKGWMCSIPWNDRMDHRAAVAMLDFISTTTATDLSSRDGIDAKSAGLQAGNTEIRCRSASGESLAFFRLGRRTPWLHLPDEKHAELVPTIYLLPLEKGRKTHVYAATGDLLPLFKNGFRYLREHRPFYLNPLALQRIKLSTAEGELTLERAQPNQAWRITKPLDLATNPASVKALLEGLYKLQATKLFERSELTLPAESEANGKHEIGITHFGSESESWLQWYSAKNADAAELLATVSDRPETIFSLPTQAEHGLVSLSELPLSVNELRDLSLTNLNIASIRGIAIDTATTPTVLISREPPQPWMATINGKEQIANESRLFDLFKACTETKALAFETDAAPEDLSPWGLHRPILSLIFLAQDNKSLGIQFGLNHSGQLFAKRNDSSTILRIENRFLEKIAVNAHEWRHARLWSFSKVDLTRITRTEGNAPSLELAYNDLAETWKATREGKDITADLDPILASYVLTSLENLQVASWLSPTDADATKALASPALSFTITENTVDDLGDVNGSKSVTLTLAHGRNIVFGKISSDPSPFTLTPENYLKLAIPLLDP